ncbi:polyphosphate kinase 1 [Lewinella cohaerens]|uniref:polyphosphate kinase 1 n=1 Tax=Lewinella cohaerens TaxID=70995 RepID=UPI00035E7891|nr:polyphosphate kinase 1 [Lewinella cohaerens]
MENTDFKYTSRDISWLHFNYRVLQEAMDKSVPLYERVKFLAIYSSNLDEFFRVRVAYLRSFKSLRKKDRKRLLDIKPKKVLKEILALVQWQQRQFGRVFREEIIPALQEEGVYLVTQDRIGAEQLKFIHQYFEEKVFPLLERKAYVDGETAPFLENRQLYFVIDHGEEKPWEVVNIPSNLLPRFLVIPSSNDDYVVMYLDDVIRASLPQFLGEQASRVYSVKVSRDAELYIDDEYSGDLLDKIKASLVEREVGLPTRFLFDQTMPESLVTNVRKAYGLSKYDMIPGGRYHNFNDFFGFPEPAGKEGLRDRKLIPLAHPRFKSADHLLSTIRERDELLHFPYQEYNYIPQLIKEAAQDPDVHTLRITLYRVAAKSDVVDGLLQALALGKKVEVFVEAKARFDEAANLYWGEELKKAGADVRYSFPGIKVHTKLLLIECTKQQDVSYLGTGNFNEQTARLYADHALLTANEEMTFDVRQVFELLTGRLILPATKHLLVAPFDLRNKLVKKINREIKHAKAGREAFIRLKMNSLEEKGMIEKLYQASNAGVKIQLIIRGICCLVPGVEGQSENIEVISILDRFLEHARIYYFFNDGKEELFTASADWMSRNLFRRVEVAIPIYDQRLRQELKDLLDIQWADNCKARIINAKQDDRYRLAAPDEAMRRSQVDYYEYLRSQLS